MADIPNTRFYEFVNTPAIIKYNQAGEAFVPLDPQGPIIKINEFRRVSVRIGSTKATAFIISMGKLAGPTLAQLFQQAIDDTIHTREIVGPEMALVLTGGPPNTKEDVQLWVYLTS
jgi:hypothetical protein